MLYSFLALAKEPYHHASVRYDSFVIYAFTLLRDYDIVNITLHFFLKDVRSMLPPAVNHSIAVS